MSDTKGRELYEALAKQVKKDVPDFRVGYKDDLTWKKDWKLKIAAAVVGVFNKEFMTRFTTTLYPVVYFASRETVEENPRQAFRILAHEYVHLFDEDRQRVLFPVSYLFPQVLALGALGALGAFWSLWFLLFLLFLVALAPLPAPWRAEWEMRGYAMNMATRYWDHGAIRDDLKEFIVDKFVSVSTYYRMWPDKKAVREELDERASLIQSGRLLDEEYSRPYQMTRLVWMTVTNEGASQTKKPDS